MRKDFFIKQGLIITLLYGTLAFPIEEASIFCVLAVGWTTSIAYLLASAFTERARINTK